MLLTASMAWVCLTDSQIAQSLWPSDIHQKVALLLGGTAARDFSGSLQVHLPWLGVVIRAIGLSLTAALCFAALESFRSRYPGADGREGVTLATFRRSFLTRIQNLSTAGFASGIWLVLWFVSSLVPWAFPAELMRLTAPLALASVGAACVCSILKNHVDQQLTVKHESGFLVRHRHFVLVVLLTGIWIAVSFRMNERLYAGLWIPHGDSGMYEEHLWNVWHGKGFRSYLDQGLFLGEHIQLIHLLLLPLHMIWPSHLLLELAESFALGICAVPIYRLARRSSGSSAAAMWLAIAWLFYYPMHFLDIAIDLKTLRPSCFALPFLLWGIDLAESGRLKAASVCLLIAMTGQEDFALVIGPVGLSIWWEHRGKSPMIAVNPDTEVSGNQRISRWGFQVCMLSVVYLLAAVLWIIPAFRNGLVVHYSRYFGELGSSPGELIRTAVRDPGKILQYLISLRTVLYLLVFLVPAGLLPVRSPVRLAAGLATFTMISLIQLGNSDSSSAGGAGVGGDLPPIPYHHFHAPLLPILFWAAAGGLKSDRKSRAESSRQSRVRKFHFDVTAEQGARFACFCAVLTGVFGSMSPLGAAFWSAESRTGYRQLYVPGPRAAEFEKVLPLLPPGARVASTDYVHTRLTHFERSYDYSDYPRAVNQYQPGVPPDTDFIVIDTKHPYSKIRSPQEVPELREHPDRWELLPDITNGYFIVLRRKTGTDKPLRP
jgi:uncharacterized membrane protein